MIQWIELYKTHKKCWMGKKFRFSLRPCNIWIKVCSINVNCREFYKPYDTCVRSPFHTPIEPDRGREVPISYRCMGTSQKVSHVEGEVSHIYFFSGEIIQFSLLASFLTYVHGELRPHIWLLGLNNPPPLFHFLRGEWDHSYSTYAMKIVKCTPFGVHAKT